MTNQYEELIGVIQIGNRMNSLKGTLSVAGEPIIIGGEIYIGPYQATPKAFDTTVLETQGKFLTNNITVEEIPYQEVSTAQGKTIIIG